MSLYPIANDKTNNTPSPNDHPEHHDLLADAANDLNSRVGVLETAVGAQSTPLIIRTGVVFTIPVDTQMLFGTTCTVDGELVVNGEMVEV